MITVTDRPVRRTAIRIEVRISESMHATPPPSADRDARRECPNCECKALRRRAAPLRANVLRRETGNVHHRNVCDECGWTGRDEHVAARVPAERTTDGYQSALGW